MHWERIEPVAESFGDLDPSWTPARPTWKRARPGPAGTGSKRTCGRAQGLHRDDRRPNARCWPTRWLPTPRLNSRTRELTFTADKLANGAKELLDEVATGKVTGEEEFWSHTDLWDFQANVDGARIAFEDLRPLLAGNDAELDTALETNFATLQGLLDKYKKGDGFVLYTELTEPRSRSSAPPWTPWASRCPSSPPQW